MTRFNDQNLTDARANVLLQQLLTATTPGQIDAWMTANVNSVAQARTVLVAIAIGLRYVLQRDL